jgi:RNAse (barnase) inhibitor barstar
MERCNIKKLNKVEGEEQYHVEISSRFEALENLGADVDVNTAWKTVGENVKIPVKEILGYGELKK